MKLTDEEERVIEILVDHGPARNPYGPPFEAVDKAMDWDTARTTAIVEDLTKRGVIRSKMGPFKGYESGEAVPRGEWSWERL